MPELVEGHSSDHSSDGTVGPEDREGDGEGDGVSEGDLQDDLILRGDGDSVILERLRQITGDGRGDGGDGGGGGGGVDAAVAVMAGTVVPRPRLPVVGVVEAAQMMVVEGELLTREVMAVVLERLVGLGFEK